jgi:hypothetical protein
MGVRRQSLSSTNVRRLALSSTDTRRESLSSFFVWLSLCPFAALLRTGNQAATIDRVFASQHVKDLRLIVAAALFAFLFLFIGFVLALSLVNGFAGQSTEGIHWKAIFHAAAKSYTILLSAVGVLGVILAWAYQTGSARLGVVDLFACEIGALCRVVTIVDVVSRYVDKFQNGPSVTHTNGPHVGYRFTSQESYFPVYESNTRDLQTLEATVVSNITAFYTYMKSFRDHLRMLAETAPQAAEAGTINNSKQVLPDVNRRANLTPDRLPILTPLSGVA